MATHSVCVPGESHGQRSLAGYSPWGCKESDMTERLTLSLSEFILEQEMVTHSTILAWEILRREEPERLQFLGLQKSWT